MTPTPLTLADSVRVRGRFHRSVNIAADWRGRARRDHYLVTPTVRSLAERMLGELGSDRGVRAWSITGPYGSGKSAFALFLTDLLTGSAGSVAPSPPQVNAPQPRRPLVPVLVLCRRAPFGPALLSALELALVPVDEAMAERARQLATRGTVADEDVVDMLGAAVESIGRSGEHGVLLIIVDELGKFL